MHDGSAGVDTLIADLCVREVWEPQTKALFDIRVVDTDARSYHAHSPQDVLVRLRLRRSTISAGLSELTCHIYSSLCICRWHAWL